MYKEIITATTIPDAWFQLIYNILDNGRVFTIDQGSYVGQKRLEFDWIDVEIIQPTSQPLLPIMPEGCNIPPPVADDYLDEYVPYLMTADKKPGEDYTYGERLCAGLINVGGDEWIPTLNQIENIINTYKKKGYRNNQLILQIAQPGDLILNDPPCLRHIDTRIQDGKLHFFIYFRSWDLWGGFPANLAGIAILMEYMAAEIGVECGQFICSSKGLHLYDYAVDLAAVRCMKDCNINLK